MIAIIATLSVRPDRIEPFEARFLQLVAAVKAEEPGARMYQLVRSATDVGDYRVMEVYEDQAALDRHMGSEHFKAAGRDLQVFMTAPLKI